MLGARILSAFLVRDRVIRGRYRGNPAPWAGKRRRYGALLPRKICSEHGSNIANLALLLTSPKVHGHKNLERRNE